MDPLSTAAVGWAISAVGWLMSALVSKAVNKLLEEWAKNNGLGDEFETLKDQLLKLNALFTSFCGLRTNNSSLKDLVQKLQQLAYEAENLLDELDYYRLEDQILQKDASSSDLRFTSRFNLLKLNGMSFRSARDAQVPKAKNFSPIIDLPQRMKKLAEKLQEYVEEVRKAVGTESNVITTQNTERSQTEATKLLQTPAFHIEPKIYGRIQEREQLINLLKNEKPAEVGKVPIVAIVGSGGVGKTTLARLVFHDTEVCSHFGANRFWIYVSSRFDIDRLTHEMLEVSCGNRYGEFSNLYELQKKRKDGLVSKRFLLVLDDMWEDKNKSQWDSMVAPLNDGMVEGSIILVTSRHESVAKMVKARDILNLKGLGNDAFLSFLSKCIFNDQNYGGDGRLRKIGEKIAEKLQGNPLAAKTVAAMLVDKPRDVMSWIKIRDTEEWISQSGPDDIMPALRLSYEHMPIHLQRCFSYCAMLPEDHTFTCEELVYLWMAQGFLNVRSADKTMEDIGSDYFNDLLKRGFFQSKPSAYGGLVCYTFHDHLLHSFARMISFEECFRINGTKRRETVPPTIRHLSIFNFIGRDKEEIGNALVHLKSENLSTVVNWDKFPSDIFQCIWDLLETTQFLRAMRITLCSQVQPETLTFQNFVSLRYLRLIMSNLNNRNTLPNEICRLYHLEVFEIEGKLQVLPKKFSDLVSLRHFLVEGNLHSKIQGVGKLTSLQELNHFNVQQEIGFEIKQLGSLKEIGGSLHIRNLENVKSEREASKAKLAEKEKLDALYLNWNRGEQENESVLEGLRPNTNLNSLTINGYGGVASPRWLGPSIFFLETLTLTGCKAWELLPPIGELEFLKHLTLSGLSVREIGPQCYGTPQSMIFPSLEELEIIDMPYLKKWVWSDQFQLFVRLKKLTIQGCTKLVDLPFSRCATSEVLERFPSLVNLKIEDCPLIVLLPPLPYSSLLSFISIAGTGRIELIIYEEKRHNLSVTQGRCPSHKLGELLAFHKLSSLHSLEISNISGLENLDLHSFVALEKLYITGCQSLKSITFGDHLVCLKILNIISCKTLSSMKGLKSWVNLECLYFRDCPGFVTAWDSASKEIEGTPEFSFSLTEIDGDSIALSTLPLCKHLTSLQKIYFEDSTTKEHELSLDLESFPFDLLPSLKALRIKFPHIQSLSTNSHTKITKECCDLENIENVFIDESPVQIRLELREEMI
ncbi:putative disease resistance protein RGA3 [Carex rostrata]